MGAPFFLSPEGNPSPCAADLQSRAKTLQFSLHLREQTLPQHETSRQIRPRPGRVTDRSEGRGRNSSTRGESETREAGVLSNLLRQWCNRKPRQPVETTLLLQGHPFRVLLDPNEDVDEAIAVELVPWLLEKTRKSVVSFLRLRGYRINSPESLNHLLELPAS